MFATIREGLAAAGRAVLAVLAAIGAMLGRLLGPMGRWLWSPFAAVGRFYMRRRIWLRIALAVLILPWLIGYLVFFWHIAWIRGFDLNYPDALLTAERQVAPGKPVAAADGEACGRSYIVDASALLLDFNVNRNVWISSNPFYKMGFFYVLEWERTRFFDNKAAFQRGVHQAVQRTLTELADTLGRVRGTSEADADLAIARGNAQFDPFTWVFNPFSAARPFGPTTRTATYYRGAEDALRRYQERLTRCAASFDERADNLLQFLDRIASDIGSTSATLLERAEARNTGWFDTQADNLFWYARGQMYAYYGILSGARADFADIIDNREIAGIWDNMEGHIRKAIELGPWVISNGAEDGLIMPSHLTAIGFYILRARANLVEIRSVLDR